MTVTVTVTVTSDNGSDNNDLYYNDNSPSKGGDEMAIVFAAAPAMEGNNDEMEGNNNGATDTNAINEKNYMNWSQMEVLNWVKMNLENNGIDDNKMNRFLNEFNEKHITGSMLVKFKNDENLLNTFINGFTELNQTFGIWMILKSSIGNVGQ